MARRSRQEILYDDCFAHVFSRALEKRWIFEEEGDFEYFKRLLREAKQKSGFSIHHYCLMNTHFHLAVSIPHLASFSRALQALQSKYTAFFNRKYHHEGPLWRGRFRSLLIENESYLYACGLYIEYNPVRARIVTKPSDWPHSSSPYYELGIPDALLDPYEGRVLPTTHSSLTEDSFTKGQVIGSDLFQLYLKEGVFQ